MDGSAAAPPETARVLLIGTDHLVDWDGENGPDILAAERQSELDELVGSLARWRPTRVALEVLASRQRELDERFERWTSAAGRAGRSEVDQIGLRLAAVTGASVHAIDADWTLDHAGVEAHVAAHPSDAPAGLSAPATAWLEASRRSREEKPISAHLLEINGAAGRNLNDREYLDGWLLIGAGAGWPGVDLVASWYRRNLRIFAELLRVATPGERVVVVFGLGHIASLRHFAEVSARIDLVELSSVLGPHRSEA